MKSACILLSLGLLLAACSSQEPVPTSNSEPATLKHLQQDGTDTSLNINRGLSILFTPTPVISGAPARLTIKGCRDKLGIKWSVNGTPINEKSTKLAHSHFQAEDEITANVTCGKEVKAISAKVNNSPPRVIAAKFRHTEITAGNPIEVIPETVDADGDRVTCTYHWIVNGYYLDAITSSTLPAEYVRKGNEIKVEIIPSDQLNDGEPFEGMTFLIPNAPPQIDSKPPNKFSSQLYSYQFKAHDPDGDPLTYFLETAPTGMKISSNGLITWPLDQASAGKYEVAIVAQDPEGLQARQTYTFTLYQPE